MQRPRIGKLRHRVRILLWRDEPDGGTGIAPSYTLLAEPWAQVESVGGAMHLGSRQVGETVTHRIVIRHRGDVTAEHVVEHGGRRYRIRRSADPWGERRFLVLECEEEGSIP